MPIASLVVRLAADIAEFESNLASAERSLQKTGRNMEQIGTQLTKGLTVPIVAIGGLALKAAIDFEDSFAGVRKTVDATEAQFKELEGAFRDLAKQMPLSVNEINKVAESAGQLGVAREDIVAFTESMIKLGTATNLTADEAATGMARFANALGQPRIDMEKLGSALVALGNAGASTEKDILALAGRMAGAGASINLTAGELFGMANALSSVGIEAEKGGSAFSTLFKDIDKAVTFGGEKLKDFAKVAFGDIEGAAQKFSDLFNKDAAGAITAFVEGLGRIKASGESLNIVLDELGIKEKRYADTVKLAANAADQFAASVRLGNKAFEEGAALDKEYQERLKTTASQLVLLKNNLMDVAVTLGQAMLPAVNRIVSGSKPVIEVLADMAGGFKALPGPIKDVSLAFIGVLAAAGPVVFIASQVVKAWASLLAIIRFVPAALNAISTAFILMAGSMGATTTGLRGMSGAMVLLRGTAAALVSSLGAIPLALTAIALALPKAIDGIKNLANAIREKRFWEFITTKDAPAIWEGAFWGMGRGATYAASAIADLGDSGGIISEDFIPSVRAARDVIAGKSGLQEAAFALANEFSSLDPAAQRSADVIKRVGQEALRLRDGGAQLTPELEKLANKAMKDIARESKAAAKELSEYAELMEKIKGASIPLSESDKKRALELHQLGLSYKGIAEALKINELAVKSYVEWQERLNDMMREQIPLLERTNAAFNKLPVNLLNPAGGSFENLIPLVQDLSGRAKGALSADVVSGIFAEPIVLSDHQLAQIAIEGVKAGRTLGIATRESWLKEAFGEEFGRQLGTILGNVVRTGNILAGIVDAGSLIGSTLGSALAKNLTTGANAITGWLGGMISAALPAIGSLLGPLVEKIAGLFDRNKGRDLVKDFAASFGGFDALHDRLLELGSAGEALWIELTQGVGRNNPEQAAAVIAEIEEALGELGTEAERAAARLDAIGVAMDGVNAKATLFAAPFQALIDKQKEGKITQDEFTASLAAMGEKGQAEFERIGVFAAAAFAGMVRETGDAIGALDRLSPALSVLQQGLKDFGLTSTGTIDALLGLFKLVHDETTGPILQAIQATGQIFAGLQDAGLLTADLFQTVSDDIGAAFRDLEAKGGDVAKAMALSQPVLQRLWEAQQIYGNVTDETTRKLLEQAEQQGIVGAHMKDVNQKILDVLLAIADVFGAKIPDSMRATRQAASDTASRIEDEFSRIKIPTIYVPVDFEYPDGAPVHDRVPFLAEGGIVRKRTLAVIGESGPEAVIPLSQLGSVAPEAGSTTVILQMDGRDVAEVVVPHIPGVARRYVTV